MYQEIKDRRQRLTTQFLANRHGLFAYIYGLVRNTHDAEDIFQEVWLRFSNAIGDENSEIQDAAKWCRGAARNLVLHYWRDRQGGKVVVDQELIELVDQAFVEHEPSADYLLARQQALGECIGELPARSREMLRLKYERGLSSERVADELAQTVAAVLMALSRIRKALRECAERKLRLEGLQS